MERVIVSDQAGTTRDAIDSYFENEHGKYLFIDTAGMRRKSKVDDAIEKYSNMRSIGAIDRCDVCLILIDANEGVTEQDTKIAGLAHEAGKACILVVNKWDLVDKDTHTMDRKTEEIRRDLSYMTYAPVLFLSARDTELDKVVGLEIGGDDYLAKPFGVRELIARVKALLRRAPAEAAGTETHDEAIEASGIKIDEGTHMAECAQGPIDLTPREFELLATLMRHAGKVLSRDQLLRDAWGWEYHVETKTVDTHVKRLRDKLESAGVDPGLIETVRGYGYRFKLL
jgi:two-component system response regulator RegX3